MSQVRRALLALVSIVAAALGFMPVAAQSAGALTPSATPGTNATAVNAAANTPGPGYWLVAGDGGIFSQGAADFHGSSGAIPLNQPIVGIGATPTGNGYWMVASDGGIFSFGDAAFQGSTGATALNMPIVGMASTPSGNGYWLVASDGGIFAFGDAHFHGSTGAMTLNKPIVGMTSTPSGHGYTLVASDGGIFSFGDADFHGSTGAMTLNKPIVGIAATPTGHGYWMAASDGGIFSFGDAHFFGSTGAFTLNMPIVGMATTPTGLGYWFVAADGGIFSFGDAQFFGAAATQGLNQAIVGMAASAPMPGSEPPATQLAFTTEPSSIASGGATFGTQPVVTVQDASGATVVTDTSNVTLSITTAGGATLTCTSNTVAAVAGVATFAGCDIDLTGSYTLTATDGSLDTAQSSGVIVQVGAAAKLGFVTQPSASTVSLVAFASQPDVAVQDLGGNTVVGATNSIALTLTAVGSPAAVLACTSPTTMSAVAGVASLFAGCNIDKARTYTLNAATAGLTAATSGNAVITFAAASQVTFVQQPSASAVSQVSLAQQPQVEVQDASGNTVTTNTSTVTLTLTTPGTATLGCTSNAVAAVAGIATFAGCDVDIVGTYTLNAADGALTAETSSSLAITAGVASQMTFTTQPGPAAINAALVPQPVVTVQDAAGNTVTTAGTVALTLTIPGGAALTCVPDANPMPTVSGVATFTSCEIDTSGSYTLHAVSSIAGVAAEDSASVVIP